MSIIRNAVKAIIIKDSKILLCKYEDREGVYYACIGGGQEPFEDMHATLRRECREEINCEINIGRMLFVREAYFDFDHGNGRIEKTHQIEHFFQCTLKDNETVSVGENPDANSIRIEWLPIGKLKGIRIFPNILKEFIHMDGSLENVVYLGLDD